MLSLDKVRKGRMNTEWKNIKIGRFEYKVSNNGNVIRLPSYISNGKSVSLRKEKEIKGSLTRKGYLAVELNGKFWFIHRLVATLFIENKYNKEQVNHKDGNKLNNCVSNLEWCNNLENMQHAYEIGLQFNDFGEKARNFKYKFRCVEYEEWGELTALEMTEKINLCVDVVTNFKATSSNIRTRLSAYGLNFIKTNKKEG